MKGSLPEQVKFWRVASWDLGPNLDISFTTQVHLLSILGLRAQTLVHCMFSRIIMQSRSLEIELRYIEIINADIERIEALADDTKPSSAYIESVFVLNRVTNNLSVRIKERLNRNLKLFLPKGFEPNWKTSDVVGVARGIYDDRAFERMPILADALMDAGCNDEELLTWMQRLDHTWWHRGCFILDTILGKRDV